MALNRLAIETEYLLSTVENVDLNDDSVKQTLYTVPAGDNGCIITKVIVRGASVSLTTAEFGFGFDANAADVIASALHSALDGATKYVPLAAKAGAVRGAPADIFGLKVTTEQGAAATVTVDVWGYLY